MDSLLSVIVPVYNVEQYVGKCIESIINQTYSNLEIILVDDGSMDKSGEICDSYQNADDRIRVIHKKNGGLSSARNCGLDICQGEFIAFIDSDDYLDSTMFSAMLSRIQSDSSDMAICGIKYVHEESTEQCVIASPFMDGIVTPDTLFMQFGKANYFYYVLAVNKIYMKELWTNIRFPIGKLHEDEFVAHYLIDRCGKISILQDELYYYLQRSSSIMNESAYNIKHLDGAEAKIDRYRFLMNKGYTDIAKSTLYGAYYIVVNGIRKTEIRYNKKYIKSAVNLVASELGLDLRHIKLLLLFYKKVIRELAAKLLSYLPVALMFFLCRKKEKMVIMATPVHGNLGDQAIVYAEKKMLRDLFPQKKIIEVSNYVYEKFMIEICSLIKPNDTIILDGGGNLGSLWLKEDDKISNIIDSFKDNKILVFPQTAFYDKLMASQKRIEKNREIYREAEKLTFLLRDKDSFVLFRENFPESKVFLCPDIVLSLDEKKRKDRKDVLLCFRSDREKVFGDEELKVLEEYLLESRLKITFSDTVVSKKVNLYNRKYELKRKWKEFSSHKLVITDRLHAMIFAYITGTPCIAVNNKSKKVEGTYDFIRDCGFVKLAMDVDEIMKYIPMMIDLESVELGKFVYPRCVVEESLKNE